MGSAANIVFTIFEQPLPAKKLQRTRFSTIKTYVGNLYKYAYKIIINNYKIGSTL